MAELNHIAAVIALTMGIAWASGINLYASILVLGILGVSGNIVLPPDLRILQEPVVIVAAGFMYFVEFFADKVPGVDSGWDALHTFIRIPAGAFLAARAVGDLNPAVVAGRRDPGRWTGRGGPCHEGGHAGPHQHCHRNRSPTGRHPCSKTSW